MEATLGIKRNVVKTVFACCRLVTSNAQLRQTEVSDSSVAFSPPHAFQLSAEQSLLLNCNRWRENRLDENYRKSIRTRESCRNSAVLVTSLLQGRNSSQRLGRFARMELTERKPVSAIVGNAEATRVINNFLGDFERQTLRMLASTFEWSWCGGIGRFIEPTDGETSDLQ